MTQDYFEVLGLRRTASDREIKEAYRRLAKMYHPDSNPDNPEASRKMQSINQAKAVLFDPVKREEHRASLGLREKLTAQRLDEMRNEEKFQRIPAKHIPTPAARMPASKWDDLWKKCLIVFAFAVSVGIIAVIVTELTAHQSAPSDPIESIILRYQQLDRQPIDSLTAVRPTRREMDTMAIAAESQVELKVHGDASFSQGDYSGASDYYEVYLRRYSDNAMAERLSHSYFKRHRYAESLEVLRENVHGDSNLVAAYYDIGQSFLHAEKPFDARDAFAAAVLIAEKMKQDGTSQPEVTSLARNALLKLE